MDGLGKQDFLADEEGGKAAPSNPNFHSIPLSWDELLSFDPPLSILREPNRQQSGHPGGTSSDVGMAEKVWRKRENDRRYRAKLKLGKLQMKSDMDSLYVENENLKKENERLQREHVSMNKTLRDQEQYIDQLKSDFDKLNDEYQKQNVLVQQLSGLLASCPDLQLENERLKLENGQLRHISSLDYNMVIADENVKLKLENKVLRVQNDALCGKLISDSDKKYA